MTPERMADLHAAGFSDDRPWTASEFAALLDGTHAHLTPHDHGFALWRAVAGEAELLTIVVDPAHRRLGTGGTLMTEWMSAAEPHANTAFLEVAADNAAACALYRRHGFSTVARRPAYYRHRTPAVDALVMRAALPAWDASP
ncbi:MAG: GNAT family N-acetyltransferase [Pseudomonadota bacterium]